MKLRTLLTIAASASLGFLSGCGGDEGDKKVIGLSILTSENEFFNVIADHMKEEAAKHGYEVIVVSGDKKPEKQDKQIRDFISQKVAAIVLSPCDSAAAGAPIREANKEGIPVFTVDIKCTDPEAKVVTHIATANYEGGKLAGQAMIEALGEGGGDVFILDFPQAESCQMRVKGFTEVIDAHNKKDGTAKINIKGTYESKGEEEQGRKSAADALQSHQNTVGIFAINDPAALGAYAALKKVGKESEVKIIGFDGQPSGKKAIKEGKIYADPIQHPDKMGIEVVRAIIKHFKGEKVEPEQLIPATLYRQADGMADKSLK